MSACTSPLPFPLDTTEPLPPPSPRGAPRQASRGPHSSTRRPASRRAPARSSRGAPGGHSRARAAPSFSSRSSSSTCWGEVDGSWISSAAVCGARRKERGGGSQGDLALHAESDDAAQSCFPPLPDDAARGPPKRSALKYIHCATASPRCPGIATPGLPGSVASGHTRLWASGGTLYHAGRRSTHAGCSTRHVKHLPKRGCRDHDRRSLLVGPGPCKLTAVTVREHGAPTPLAWQMSSCQRIGGVWCRVGLVSAPGASI